MVPSRWPRLNSKGELFDISLKFQADSTQTQIQCSVETVGAHTRMEAATKERWSKKEAAKEASLRLCIIAMALEDEY